MNENKEVIPMTGDPIIDLTICIFIIAMGGIFIFGRG